MLHNLNTAVLPQYYRQDKCEGFWVNNTNTVGQPLDPTNYWKPLGQVVQKVDNAIHRINLYPANTWFVLLTLIYWIVIYPVNIYSL